MALTARDFQDKIVTYSYRASEAFIQKEKPLVLWTRDEVIEALQLNGYNLELVYSLTDKEFFQAFLLRTSWHHVFKEEDGRKKAYEVLFYIPVIEQCNKMNKAELQEHITASKNWLEVREEL